MAKQALPGKRLTAFLMDPNDVTIVGLDTDDGPEHPLYDERILEDLDENLVRNIRMMGVIDPVKVRKNGEVAEVVDGRRRVRAAREAARRQIEAGEEPVRIKVLQERGSDGRVMGVLIASNEHRKEDTPLNRARKLERYLAVGRTPEEAAVTFGVTVVTIRNWLKLLELSPEMKAKIDKGEISASAATKLADLPRDEQDSSITEIQESGQTPTNAVVAKKAAKKRTPTGRPKRPGVALIRNVLKVEEEEWAKKNSKIEIPEAVLETLRWVSGKSDGSKIPGLKDVLKIIEREESADQGSGTEDPGSSEANDDEGALTSNEGSESPQGSQDSISKVESS